MTGARGGAAMMAGWCQVAVLIRESADSTVHICCCCSTIGNRRSWRMCDFGCSLRQLLLHLLDHFTQRSVFLVDCVEVLCDAAHMTDQICHCGWIINQAR